MSNQNLSLGMPSQMQSGASSLGGTKSLCKDSLCAVCGKSAHKKMTFPDKVVLLCGKECVQFVGADGNILQRAAQRAKEGIKKLLPGGKKDNPEISSPQTEQGSTPQETQGSTPVVVPSTGIPTQQGTLVTQMPTSAQRGTVPGVVTRSDIQGQQGLPRSQVSVPTTVSPQIESQRVPQTLGPRQTVPQLGPLATNPRVTTPVFPQQSAQVQGSQKQVEIDPKVLIRPLNRQLWQEHVSKTRDVITSFIDAAKARAVQNKSNQLEEDQRRLLQSNQNRAPDLDTDIAQILRSNAERRELGEKFVKALETSRDTEIQRLLGNQREIGTLVGTILNNRSIGSTLSNLLIQHINGAAVILSEAAKSPVTIQQGLQLLGSDPLVRSMTIGRSGAQKSQNPLVASIQSWYDNGDDIVQFLDAIEVPALPEFPGGPRRTVMEKVWPASLIRPAFYKHLYQTIVEAVQYLNEDYRGSIQTADQATSHMLVVADILTNGLVRIVQPQDLLTAAKNAEITFEQSRKSTTIFEK